MPVGHLLIVDDVAENRDLLSRRLERRGYTTTAVADGAAALSALADTRFDLILLDVQMPGMSGIEVLTRVREVHAKTALPVIMVSALSESTDVVRALQLGANDYVTKPVDFPVALARIEAQIALRAEVQEQIRQDVVIQRTEDLSPGFVLDQRYRIQGLIGEGGFAVVYRAVQLETGQTVAIKLLRADRLLKDGGSVEIVRFEQEMRLIARINHPNIVRLYDSGRIRVCYAAREPSLYEVAVGEVTTAVVAGPSEPRPPFAPTQEASLPYLVMELLEGETLADVLAREVLLDAEVAVDLMLPVISALAAAHANDVVHRDLKPHNIFLVTGPGGRRHPRVLDFGVAKLLGDGADDLTKTASILGTPEFMAPEQARGVSRVTPAADQYSVAVCLYQALTGKSPYQAQSFIELIHEVAAGEGRPLGTMTPALPAELTAAVERAMATDPEDRFASMIELGRALLPVASAEGRAAWTSTFEEWVDVVL